jgi:hypothetical protein
MVSQQVKRGRRLVRRGACVSLILIWTLPCIAPAGQESTPGLISQHPRNPFDNFGDQDPVFIAKQMRAMNADRQKSLIADGNRLVQLARELNSEIASGSTNLQTTGDLRKVAEIEKLAHNVKQKMSFAGGGGPIILPPLQGPLR